VIGESIRMFLRKNSLLLLLTFLIIVRIGIGLVMSNVSMELNLFDVGQWVDAGDKMLSGQVLGRDFMAGSYGPLLYVWSTFWYWLFGANWHAVLVQLEIVSPVACLILAYVVSIHSFVQLKFRMAFLLLTSVLGLDHCFWTPHLRIWLPMVSAVLAEAAVRRRNPKLFSVSAGMAGVCLMISPESGIAALACCSLFCVAALMVSRENRQPWLIAFAAGFGLVLGMGVVGWPDVMIHYASIAHGLAKYTNWFHGLPYEKFQMSFFAYIFYWPFAVILAFVGIILIRISDVDVVEGLRSMAWIVFCVILFRPAMGRSDPAHLINAIPPFMLLWCRMVSRMEGFRLSTRVLIAIAALLPYWFAPARTVSAFEHISTRLSRSFHSDYSILGNEDVYVAKGAANQWNDLRKYVQARVPEDSPILYLPIPAGAHLMGRRSAFPLTFSELLLLTKNMADDAIKRLESQNIPMVVLDRLLIMEDSYVDGRSDLPMKDIYLQPLTSSSPADEIITRKLRAWIRRNYDVDTNLHGADILVRRPTPRPDPLELISGELVPDSTRAIDLTPTDYVIIQFPKTVCDEIRMVIDCRWNWKMETFAKAFLQVYSVNSAGHSVGGMVPVPPPDIGNELRIRMPGVLLDSVHIKLLTPGPFNPKPRSLTIRSVRSVEFPEYRTEGAGY